jgi:hypothetical protein
MSSIQYAMTRYVAAGLLVVALITSVIYEQIGQRRDRLRLPQVGRSVDIGGRSLTSGTSMPPYFLFQG